MAINSTTLQAADRTPIADLVTIMIANFNGEEYLTPTLKALLELNTGCRLVVLDDGSTDGSRALVREHFPTVDLIAFGRNEGLAYARKRAVEECRTPYLMLMDNDITYKPDCIPRLLQQLRLHPNALSCRPRLVYANQPDVIYQDAASLHYLAVSAGQIRDQPVSEGLKPYPRQTIGGGIMLLNCAIARDLGNFDENYLFGWSDGELDMRARLLGFVALQDPYAVAYHIERAGSLRRVVGQLYNRRRLILICYSARSLVVLGPALLLFEIVTFLMCLMSRYGKQYWEAWRLLKRDFRDIRSRRQELQSSSRRLGDRVVLTGGSISITGRMAGSRVVLAITPILSGFFWLYWKLTGPLIQGQNDLPELASSQPVQDQAQ